MNFAGVMLGGLVVAYTLIELIPANILIPPDGNPTLALLFSLTSATLLWNVGTWYFGLPCSSSHAIIGAILGIAIVHALADHAPLATAVDWRQAWKVGEALIFSPLAGLILAGLLFRLLRRRLPNPHLHMPPEPGQPPVAWLRAILILTSTGVSFAHGLNDGQKNIGLIMLTIIGLTPLQYAINLDYPAAHLPQLREATARLDDLLRGQPVQQEPTVAAVLASAHYLHQVFSRIGALSEIPPSERRQVRSAIYQIDEPLKLRLRSQQGDARQRLRLQQSRVLLLPVVQYVPAWVRLLSAACLGLGAMVGYRRIVHTLGERIGITPLTRPRVPAPSWSVLA